MMGVATETSPRLSACNISRFPRNDSPPEINNCHHGIWLTGSDGSSSSGEKHSAIAHAFTTIIRQGPRPPSTACFRKMAATA